MGELRWAARLVAGVAVPGPRQMTLSKDRNKEGASSFWVLLPFRLGD